MVKPALRQELREYFERNIPSGEFLAYVAEDDGRIIATSGMVFIKTRLPAPTTAADWLTS